jgi:hypothetical protein
MDSVGIVQSPEEPRRVFTHIPRRRFCKKFWVKSIPHRDGYKNGVMLNTRWTRNDLFRIGMPHPAERTRNDEEEGFGAF